MPPVREINTDDGLYIKMSNGLVFHDTAVQVVARLNSTPGNLKKKEAAYNQWLQSQEPFQKTYPVDEYEIDHQVHSDPGNLPTWRIMAGAYVGEIIMFITVHIFELSPLRFTICCRNKQSGPITEDDWWL